MKKTIKLIPAIVMLLVSAILVSTSTYAWFSMNSKVLVTGMVVTTKVNNNIQIAPANSADTTYDGNQEVNYLYAINQPISALLEPVSTVNGVSYYYTATSNVKADGDAKTETYTAYNPADTSGFNTNYGTSGAVGYADYSFYIKATNSDAAARQIYLSKCNLLYKGAALTSNDKAWRVAMFVQDAEKETKQVTDLAAANVVTILTVSGATNFDTTPKAIGSTGLEALNYGSSYAAYNRAAVIDSAVNPGETEYYKITLRLWLEGEDSKCNNDTYADLTKDYTLDLVITIGQNDAGEGDNTTAVTAIGSAAVAILTGTGATRTAALDVAGETAASYAWKNAATGAAASGTANEASYTASADGSFYCEITTNKGNIYRTPTYDYAAS